MTDAIDLLNEAQLGTEIAVCNVLEAHYGYVLGLVSERRSKLYAALIAVRKKSVEEEKGVVRGVA